MGAAQDGRAVALMMDMKHLVNSATVFAPLIASVAHRQVSAGLTCFSVYNVPTESSGPQQFVIKVADRREGTGPLRVASAASDAATLPLTLNEGLSRLSEPL